MSEATTEELTRLADRFVDDADDLSEGELATLARGAACDASLAARLRDQLQIDELLRQRLSPDRGDFAAQVRQRLSDHQRGESELDLRTEELRRLAMGQLAEPIVAGRRRSPVLIWASLASVLLAVACAALAGILGGTAEVARIGEVSGEVFHIHGGERSPADPGQTLAEGDSLEATAGGAATLLYEDATQVDLASDSTLRFEPGAGKQIWLERGELLASIAPQPANRPMIFRTPSARAVVVGTKLRLRAFDEETELEVIEGAVEIAQALDDVADEFKPITVSATQTAVANRQRLAVRSAAWPLYRQGLVVIAPTGSGEGLRRSSEKERLTAFRFATKGEVSFDGARAIRFAGGSVDSRQAGADIVEFCRRSKAFSLEIIFRASSWKQSSESVLVASGKDEVVNFELARVGDWLTWKVNAAGEKRELRLAHLRANEQNELAHVVIAVGDAGTFAFMNGQPLLEDASQVGGFEDWRDGSLRLGGDASGARPFEGELLGAAIYDRALTRDEAQASSRRLPVDFAAPE